MSSAKRTSRVDLAWNEKPGDVKRKRLVKLKGHQVHDVILKLAKLLCDGQHHGTLISMTQTCRVWYLASAPFLWRHVQLNTTRQFKSLEALFVLRPVQSILVRHWVQRFTVSDCAFTPVRSLQTWLPHFSQLVSLSLCGRTRMRSTGFLTILSRLPHPERLRELDLSGCSQLGDDDVVVVANKCRNLRSLCLANVPMGDRGIYAISLNLNHLEVLTETVGMSEEAFIFFLLSFDEGFQAATNQLAGLPCGKLAAGEHYEAVTKTLRARPRKLADGRQLRRVEFVVKKLPSYGFLTLLPSAESTLESLMITWLLHYKVLDVAAFLSIACGPVFTSLKKLEVYASDLSGLPTKTDSLLPSFPNLETLHLPLAILDFAFVESLSGLDELGRRIAVGTHSLHTVSFNNVQSCDQAAVVRLIQGCPRLHHLRIQHRGPRHFTVLHAFASMVDPRRRRHSITMSRKEIRDVRQFFGIANMSGETIAMPARSYAWMDDLDEAWRSFPPQMRPRTLDWVTFHGPFTRLNAVAFVYRFAGR